MSSPRKHYFPTTSSTIWDLMPLLDHGDPALDDVAAVGFSLLPRVMDAPMLEHARAFLSVRGARRSPFPFRETMRVVPRGGSQPDYRHNRLDAWETIAITLPARLEGLRSHQPRGGKLTLSIHYHLHRTYPILVWELAAANQSSHPLALTRATLLRVGPEHQVSQHRRSDFIPTRFRLFRLRRPPKAQSAYYDLTERFGSLRLHPLDALPFTTHTPDPQRAARALPETPRGFAPAQAWMLAVASPQRALLLMAGQAAFPAAWDFQVNPDPFAPGLTLRLTPSAPPPLLAPGSTLTLPPVLLAWLDHPTL